MGDQDKSIVNTLSFIDGMKDIFGNDNFFLETQLFDKDYLIHEASLIYSFRRPLAFHLFDYRFEASSVFPKICIDCVNCGHAIGYIESAWKSDEKTFYVISRSVYLETK
jgi:hypothetical protein